MYYQGSASGAPDKIPKKLIVKYEMNLETGIVDKTISNYQKSGPS